MAKSRKEKHRCGICKSLLNGISSKGSKTQKKVSRPFSGLCVKCYERIFKLAKRYYANELREEEIELKYLPYIKSLKRVSEVF